MARTSPESIARNRDKARLRARAKRLKDRKGMNAAMASWRSRNVEHLREYRLRRAHGIGFAERAAMLAAQGNKCGICPRTKPDKKGWVIDHDHLTGMVRGVLCTSCNTLLGRMGDNEQQVIDNTNQLLEYLRGRNQA